MEVLLKGGYQHVLGMLPDTVTQARISQNTTGKGFLEAFGEAGMGQLRELVSTKYLTGVEENGDRSAGDAGGKCCGSLA
ncbi:MAG: hypothetical protein KF784_02310 [Fimbriimonadaceae bacterium]|nr:hypothetical protein [Fimbriimonadaceae bacterium]